MKALLEGFKMVKNFDYFNKALVVKFVCVRGYSVPGLWRGFGKLGI